MEKKKSEYALKKRREKIISKIETLQREEETPALA